MSEFGGLLKHQKNPACTKSVTGLQNAEFGHYTEEEEEMPHICALTDRNAIEGNCCCWTADTNDEETAALVAYKTHYPVRARMKEQKLLNHCAWDNYTDDAKN